MTATNPLWTMSHPRQRNPSIGDDDNDDELAKEVQFLQQRGILPKDFPSDSNKYDDDDLCEELDELLNQGAISEEEVTRIKERQKLGLDIQNQKVQGNDVLDTQRQEQIVPPFSSDGIPVNWYRNTSPRAFFSLVQIKKGDPEFDIIESEFKEANILVTKIERIQNKRLLERFKGEMEDIKQHHSPEFQLNIRYLYHGTNVDKERLCEEGLDQRLSRMGYFGKGIYFSDNPIKCVHYSEDASNKSPDEACILKCRVILGDAKVYAPGCYDLRLQREPEKENATDGWRYYDSVMGCPKDYNEFVVYENRRAMIEYIISFKVDRKTADKIKNESRANTKTRRRSTEEVSSSGNSNVGEVTAPMVSNEDHFKRISEVREAVRRKRLEEAGKMYIPPSEDQIQHDKEMWVRLQKLHGVDPEERPLEREFQTQPASFVESSNHSNSGEDQQTVPGGTESYQLDHCIYENEQSDNPVEQVLSVCVAEFLAVTDMDDSNLAKYYVQKAEMDVNKAISFYYEDLG